MMIHNAQLKRALHTLASDSTLNSTHDSCPAPHNFWDLTQLPAGTALLCLAPWQELCKQYWTFEYAEQSCLSDYQALQDLVKQKPSKDTVEDWFKQFRVGLGKVGGWQRTLRTGQTKLLEESMSRMLSLVCEDRKGVAEGEQTSEKQEIAQWLDASKLAELCQLATTTFNREFVGHHALDATAKELTYIASCEVQAKLRKDLHEGFAVFAQDLDTEDKLTKENMEIFVAVCKKSQGITLPSDACTEEDLLPPP